MEFVIVTFPNRRQVFMDDQPSGQTGDRLTVQARHHDFDLGSPPDYSPALQTVNVAGTTALNPLIIAFNPMPAAVGAAADTTLAAPPARRAAPRAAAAPSSRRAKKAKTRKARPRRTSRKRASPKKKSTASKR